MAIFIKNDSQIEKMRVAGRIVARAHELLQKAVRPGITTLELDGIAEDYIRSCGAIPSFKGYKRFVDDIPFTGSICSSVNEEVIHGIPGLRKLKDGDIISIDLGAIKDGFHGDAARTIAVGSVDTSAQQLIDVTQQSFFEGIRYAKDGCRLYDISNAIDAYTLEYGYSQVREYCGHGIGRSMHEDPQIPNYTQKKRGPRLCVNMTLAIEPMVNMGSSIIEVLDDEWTVVTKDRKWSAHYENTIRITDGEPEILTL